MQLEMHCHWSGSKFVEGLKTDEVTTGREARLTTLEALQTIAQGIGSLGAFRSVCREVHLASCMVMAGLLPRGSRHYY